MYMILIRLVTGRKLTQHLDFGTKFFFFSKGKISIVVVEKVKVEKPILENISDASSLLHDNYSAERLLSWLGHQ